MSNDDEDWYGQGERAAEAHPISRAADVLRDAHGKDHYRTDTLSPRQAAEALYDAGLLVTPEIQAVLDIIDTLPDGMLTPHQRGTMYAYLATVG